MRIAILAPHAGHVAGGIETTAKGLRDHFLPEYECTIFSLTETPWTTRVPGIRGPQSASLVTKLRLHYLNHLIPYVYIIKNYALSEFTYSYNLVPLLRHYNPDIIINLSVSIIALFCKYFRSKFKVPFINVGEAGCIYMEVKSAMTRPDAYVALTPAAKKYIEKRVSGLRVEVIPNGVNLSLFSPQGQTLKKDYLLSKSGNTDLNLTHPFILSSSRLVREKRLDLLIRAVSRLKKGTLILVGDGAAKKKLFNLGCELLKNRIVFAGTISQEELAKLYRLCDVFSLPSHNEAFGNVIVEAMASGLPVVATNDEGFQWIVGDRGGILVDVTDTKAYAQALNKAYESDFGDGPEKQAQRFSWQVVIKEYLMLMESILSRNKQRVF
jgi:glycosyltransferase involved in cell wall biosynthesis